MGESDPIHTNTKTYVNVPWKTVESLENVPVNTREAAIEVHP